MEAARAERRQVSPSVPVLRRGLPLQVELLAPEKFYLTRPGLVGRLGRDAGVVVRVPHDTAGQSTGVLAIFKQDLAVDDGVVDTLG